MSALTKLFVVLLVVLSIVSSAAFVTYVNTVNDSKAAVDAAAAGQRTAEERIKRLSADLESARAAAAKNLTAVATQIESMRQASEAAAKTLADRDAQLARMTVQQELQTGDLGRLTEALKSSEDTKSQLQGIVSNLRQDNDKLLKQNSEQSITITDLTNKLEITERERRFLAEQFAEAQNQATKLGKALRDMGGDVASILQTPTGLRGGAPAINGVVRATRDIAGVPYATISVGSADSVVKGMEFKIVDRDSGKFLGVLTVDSVEPNEATGRIDGPAIAEVRPGVEVRTQL